MSPAEPSHSRLRDQSVSLCMGGAYFAAGKGGIARLARLTTRALADMSLPLRIESYLDDAGVDVSGHPVHSARGDKLRFTLACHRAAANSSHFMFDAVGVARARPRLPGFARPYGLWMCGTEVWEGLTSSSARSLRNASLKVAISQHTVDRYRELHGDATTIPVCWLGTEEDEPPQLGPDFRGPPSALIVGRIDQDERYSKGHAELVEAWPSVVAAVPDAKLLVVGGGSGLAALREKVAASPVAGSIEVAGFVPEDRMPDYWRRAHLFAMPSRGEGFGFVYVEAMRYGLPVIASVHDAGQEVNAEGVSGHNVSLDRPGALVGAVTALLSQPRLRNSRAIGASERWRNHFRYSTFSGRFRPLIEALVSQRSGRRSGASESGR